VGTGKILLNFCEYFEEAKGIDISDRMLSVASQNVQKFRESHPTHTIILQKNHVMDLGEEEKFDLITVGQAFHFFPGKESLLSIKRKLNEGGLFMLFGYVLREVHSENPSENELFYKFYKRMLPYFTFDMY
jgi:ubiquinone/menaquinone biosynthesis C-methylase UbiE